MNDYAQAEKFLRQAIAHSSIDWCVEWLNHSKTLPEETLKKMTMSIDELELSVRSYNCLKDAHICSVAELMQYTPAELLRIKSLGKKSFLDIAEALAQIGLKPWDLEWVRQQVAQQEAWQHK